MDADMTQWKFGFLLGRVLAAYGAVWLVCLLLARGNLRQSFRRSVHPWSLLAIALFLAVGFLGAALRVTGQAA